MGLAAALELAAAELDGAVAALRAIGSRLRRSLASEFPWAHIVTPESGAIPNTLSVVFPGLDGRALVVALDLEGVAVSVGSACASGSIEPSRVLLALGYSAEDARSAIRISFGPRQTAAEADEFVARLRRVVSRLSVAGDRSVCQIPKP
jgi:cysteine desulfurase